MGDSIYGSMISFDCKTMNIRDLFLEKIKLFTLAESLGGVESLVCVPYNMTHASVPKEIKQSMGLSQNLIRLSVGIEYLDDLNRGGGETEKQALQAALGLKVDDSFKSNLASKSF